MNKTKTKTLEEKNYKGKLGKKFYVAWTEDYTRRLGMLKMLNWCTTTIIMFKFFLRLRILI